MTTHPSPASEQIVSPQELADMFDAAAQDMRSANIGQQFGSCIIGYIDGTRFAVKRHRTRERVTHARLVMPVGAGRQAVAHEVHFPSRDREVGDYEAGRAIFEAHTYDETGARLTTERSVVDQVDMASPAMHPFLEKIPSLGQER